MKSLSLIIAFAGFCLAAAQDNTMPPTMPPRLINTEVPTDPPTTIDLMAILNGDDDNSTAAANTTEVPPTTTTTTPAPCDINNDYYPLIKDFTKSAVFMELSENEQIFIYEMVASVEGCDMAGFVKPSTVERIMRMLLDLPIKYITMFVGFVATALTNEGVVVPV